MLALTEACSQKWGPSLRTGDLGMPLTPAQPYPYPTPRPAGHIRTWATAFPSGHLIPRGV